MDLTYGVKKSGMNYDRGLFGMKVGSRVVTQWTSDVRSDFRCTLNSEDSSGLVVVNNTHPAIKLNR